MNFELLAIVVAIIGVGITLGRMIANGQRRIQNEITEGQKSLKEDIAGLRDEQKAMRRDMGDLRERMAHLEGLLEGLREAISHNRDRQTAA